jgi:hypothetical protein
MSEVDLDSHVLSGDAETGDEKMVPVGEAIRYRKRAQSAEKSVASLEEQVQGLRAQNERLSGELGDVRLDHELANKLSAAGVCDVEAAVLIAKARIAGSDEKDVDVVIEQLRNEKGYLFDTKGRGVVSVKTAGVKEERSGGRRVLESRAKKAAVSGSRVDLHEYMRVRRQFV